MDDRQNNAEQEFFQWLPSAVSPSALNNSRLFERTKPAYCSLAGETITGKNWARILVAITEHEIEKQNPALDELYKKPLVAERS